MTVAAPDAGALGAAHDAVTACVLAASAAAAEAQEHTAAVVAAARRIAAAAADASAGGRAAAAAPAGMCVTCAAAAAAAVPLAHPRGSCGGHCEGGRPSPATRLVASPTGDQAALLTTVAIDLAAVDVVMATHPSIASARAFGRRRPRPVPAAAAGGAAAAAAAGPSAPPMSPPSSTVSSTSGEEEGPSGGGLAIAPAAGRDGSGGAAPSAAAGASPPPTAAAADGGGGELELALAFVAKRGARCSAGWLAAHAAAALPPEAVPVRFFEVEGWGGGLDGLDRAALAAATERLAPLGGGVEGGGADPARAAGARARGRAMVRFADAPAPGGGGGEEATLRR
ncbi:hypothetical protein BU14_0161s0001 [Porphyra umbilicalis]|uniref:Uncharacterized protein n=1 Tax=Porphyra umbilicalis TaxID=2786 RepID=A0A1X6P873_PORUM|nr:hypothetical protein BU14_0161s0001 [Porphyra umbilicalis]|eukprot:OSX77079.1 hypothetical protein BU14_0161s0001 [Porphyra umbilicalis]